MLAMESASEDLVLEEVDPRHAGISPRLAQE